MKLAGILFVVPLMPAFAQTAPPQASQHGLRADTRITPLFDPPETATSASPYAQFETWVEQLPSDYAESILTGFTGVERAGNSVTLQRFFRDHFRKVYVSYTVIVERLPNAGANDAGSYRVSFRDTDVAPPTDLRPREEWKIAAPTHYPIPQLARDGDEIRIDLFTNDRGVKLVDYIHIGRQDKMVRRRDAARDSYAEDAEFGLAQPKLTVNGVAQEAIKFPEVIRGQVVWIYVPGQGRYVLSYNRHDALRAEPVGEVGGNLMTLLVGKQILRVTSSDRIAPGGGVYNVYGLQVPGWQPADPKDRGRFMVGTSPGIELTIGH